MPATFEHRWPPRWSAILTLLPTSAGFLWLASFETELPAWFNLICALLGLVALAGAIAGAVQTTVAVRADGVVELSHRIGGLTLHRQTVAGGEVVAVRVDPIPIAVAPGRRPRNTYALCLVRRDDVRRIYEDDDRDVVARPASLLAAALGAALLDPARR